mgnify:CR=1 FL=1
MSKINYFSTSREFTERLQSFAFCTAQGKIIAKEYGAQISKLEACLDHNGMTMVKVDLDLDAKLQTQLDGLKKARKEALDKAKFELSAFDNAFWAKYRKLFKDGAVPTTATVVFVVEEWLRGTMGGYKGNSEDLHETALFMTEYFGLVESKKVNLGAKTLLTYVNKAQHGETPKIEINHKYDTNMFVTCGITSKVVMFNNLYGFLFSNAVYKTVDPKTCFPMVSDEKLATLFPKKVKRNKKKAESEKKVEAETK